MSSNEETNNEKSEKQKKNTNFDWLKAYHWQKGQSGNPNGRPKSQSMKAFAREFLANLSEEDRIEFFKSVDPELVWRMSEGNPKQDTDVTTNGESLTPLLVKIIDDKVQ